MKEKEDWGEKETTSSKWKRREEGVTLERSKSHLGVTLERGRSEERRRSRSRERSRGRDSDFPLRKRFRTDDFLPDLKPGYRNDEKVYISVKEIQVAKRKIALLEDENKGLKRSRERMEKDFNEKELVLKREYEEQFKRHKEDISQQGNLIQLCQKEINELKKRIKEELNTKIKA